MKRTQRKSFLREAAVGLVISLAAAAIATAAAVVLPQVFVTRLVIAAIGLTCVLRTIAQSEERTGRVVTVTLWGVLAIAAWMSGVGLPAYVVLHAVLIWLVRSLFCYTRLVEPVLDLGLTVLAISFAVWAGLRTDSAFLAAWCFLLVQGLHVAIPALAAAALADRRRDVVEPDDDPGFEEAYRAADEALRRIASRP